MLSMWRESDWEIQHVLWDKTYENNFDVTSLRKYLIEERFKNTLKMISFSLNAMFLSI